jgi:hypothetical protein
MVFLSFSYREKAKNEINDKSNRREKTTGKRIFFLNCFGKRFLTWISLKTLDIPLVEKRKKAITKVKNKKNQKSTYLPR